MILEVCIILYYNTRAVFIHAGTINHTGASRLFLTVLQGGSSMASTLLWRGVVTGRPYFWWKILDRPLITTVAEPSGDLSNSECFGY